VCTQNSKIISCSSDRTVSFYVLHVLSENVCFYAMWVYLVFGIIFAFVILNQFSTLSVSDSTTRDYADSDRKYYPLITLQKMPYIDC
jgi:hypothetical protein